MFAALLIQSLELQQFKFITPYFNNVQQLTVYTSVNSIMRIANNNWLHLYDHDIMGHI